MSGRRLRRAPGVRDRPRHARALAAHAWDEPSPWRRPRRREGRERRRTETGTAGTAVSSREALPSSPNARSKETDREAHPADEILVTEPRAHAKRVVTGTWSPRLALDVQNELPDVRRRGVASPRPAERESVGARRRGTERAREKRRKRRRATRDSRVREPRLVRLAGSHARAAVHRRARARAARAARDAGLRAPLRAGETRRRGSSPRNPMETPATPTSARHLVSSSGASALLDVSAGEARRRSRSRVRAAIRRRAAVSRRCARRGRRAREGQRRRRARGAARRLAGYWPRRNRRNRRFRRRFRRRFAVAANGERKSGATRRQTPRFVSSATGAAPMEGWTTPAASSRGTRQTRNVANLEFSRAKTRQDETWRVRVDAGGTPLSQVFKATKTFGGGTRGSGAANPEARQTISVSAFVTPVDVARERKRAAAAESPGPGAAVRAKRRRA